MTLDALGLLCAYLHLRGAASDWLCLCGGATSLLRALYYLACQLGL